MDRHRKPSKQPREYKSSYKMEFSGDDLTYFSFVRIKIAGAYDLYLGFLPVRETGVCLMIIALRVRTLTNLL